ncbi:MAG: cytochrome b/b6 domain-containing protein [Thiothrix sp.]|uniref:cytochrome b/b6 domain-containing protein n=1 Tax=Thiothrix sp. TaxID=1032 RepID=UPI0026251F0A|nr:cytochrome b/b6 domain-containing protein [Thiothrix sp.]MDD5392621.1 cytochrome b/b6 domain-containing protein [Thiothrix sp.]
MSAVVNRIYLYKGYERFWHWSQAGLIFFMLFTGFEVHGTYEFWGFKTAVEYHIYAAWALLVLWAFTIFWQFTTGEWRHYIPSLKKVDAMIKYYTYGIFVHAPNPYQKTTDNKHNPLQRLAYLAVLSLMSPLVWGSGLFYLFYGVWQPTWLGGYLPLDVVAFVHTAGAFMFLIFIIAHIYLTTTGHTVFAHIKTMITGWEEIEEEHK